MTEHLFKVFITNGRVAWEIPKENGIAVYYENGYYLPPDGWQVTRGLVGEWREIPCGMFVKEAEHVETKKHEESTKVVAAPTG